MKFKVAVIGAGVIGLSAAYKILQDQKSCQVTVFSKEFSPNTTGDISAGFIYPFLSPENVEVSKWFKLTLDRFAELHKLPNAYEIGIQPCFGYNLDEDQSQSLLKLLPCFEKLSEKECYMLHSGISTGTKLTTWTCLCSKYLPWLLDKIKNLGGLLIKKEINSFEDLSDFDVIVNCSGLSSIYLAGDTELKPLRGQVMVVKAPWIKYSIMRGYDYILTRLDDIVIGGTGQEGNFNLKVDPHDSSKIWTNCCKLNPSLKYAEVVGEHVGLRPYRKNIRIEIEEKVLKGKKVAILHNYGHGGSGVTLHWGCAIECSQILQDYLKQKNLDSKL